MSKTIIQRAQTILLTIPYTTTWPTIEKYMTSETLIEI